MKIKILLIILSLVGCVTFSGCATKTAVIKKTDKGIEFDMNKTGKLTYKDGDVEATMDTRTPSVLEDLIKLWGIRMLNER